MIITYTDLSIFFLNIHTMKYIIFSTIIRRLDDDMRAAMAIDWIAREREKPGKKNSYDDVLKKNFSQHF
jgi:hypothetical protein